MLPGHDISNIEHQLGIERFVASRILRFIVNARANWQGDLDRYLISLCFLSLKYSKDVRSGPAVVGHDSLSIQSISDMTGIPRESTRRKVDIMVGMGDLVLNPDKTLSLGVFDESFDIVREILSYRERFNI